MINFNPLPWSRNLTLKPNPDETLVESGMFFNIQITFFKATAVSTRK